MKKNNTAFTLAEVLITLAIIGVIASITIPALVGTTMWRARETELKKAYLTLENMLQMYKFTNGNPAACYYWDKSPYSGGGASCVAYNAAGECSKYAMGDGSPLPSDYNGVFTECAKLADFMRTDMKLRKYCPINGVADGCMPEYKGLDSLYKDKNPDGTDVDATKATTGCGGFRAESLKTKMTFVTADGMIFFLYAPTTPIVGVDTNGVKGPNQWGYDVHAFMLKGNSGGTNFAPGGCEPIDKGGRSTHSMLFTSQAGM